MNTRIMGSGNVPVLHVDNDGAIVRGLALPFGEEAVVEGPKGGLVAEIMDRESIGKIEPDLPLLASHDRGRPVGVVRSTAVTEAGLLIEGKLVASDDELQAWRRRLRHGLMSALSVGFARRGRDAYERPSRKGGLPIVRPRDILIVEISLVQWGAYERAGVTSLSLRSAADEQRHQESERIIAEWTGYRAVLAHRQARRREG